MQSQRAAAVAASNYVPNGAAAANAGLGAAGLRRTLMARATFGHQAEDRGVLDAMGFDAWLDSQLDPQSIDDAALESKLASYAWLGIGSAAGMDAAQLRQSYGGGGWRLSEDSKAVRILRAKESKRQLLERVVDLWNDHFNVPFTAQDANYLRPVHEERVIRRQALGHFPDLLMCVAKSPAMGAFLDQDSNRAGQPNENYARELLELHTLGEGNGYTEQDVREVARCFTGWTYVRHWEPGAFGTFRFDPAAYDGGTKVVLGQTITGAGELDAMRVLRQLALDHRTARRISAKMIRRFLGEDAASGEVLNGGRSILDRVTDTYTATGGHIPSMLREVLSQGSLRAVQPWRSRLLKQPFHFAISFLRALDVRITNPTSAIYGLAGLGQVPFEWPDPDGYPEAAEAWESNLAPRWRFASVVLNGWTSWSSLPPAQLAAYCQGVPASAWGRCVSAALTAGEMEVSDVAAVQSFVNSASGTPGQSDRVGAFELGASSPSFQTI